MATQRLLGIEKKYIDYTFGATVIQAAWAGAEMDPAANCLAAPTQGSGETQRDGRKITIKNIHVNGAVYRDSGGVMTAQSTVHVALVLDTQTLKQQLSAEDVYNDANNVEFSYRDVDHLSRFKVLWSRRFVMGNDAGGWNGVALNVAGDRKNFSINKAVNIPVTFSAAAGSVADIEDNSLHIIAVSSQGAIDYLAYESRIRFVG